MDDDTRAAHFEEVRRTEWEQIQERRAQQLYNGTYSGGYDSENPNPPQNLVGLALSGGGIRSATFCLGLLQGMDKLRLIRIFDYLSTVSGGGYVGGWWSAWLARDQVTGQTAGKFAVLRAENFKNLSGLAFKLARGLDAVSETLRNRFSDETKKLLATFEDPESTPSEELSEALVKELNDAIADNFFYMPLRKPTAVDTKDAVKIEESDEDRATWLRINRALLEEAYSYEFRDIFPPREKIESERPRRGSTEAVRKEVEGATSAWRDPVHHLRLFASYLTPRKGMLSADTWRAVSVVTRNLALTWLILLPLLVALVLAGQLFFQVMHDVFGPLAAPGPVARERLIYLAIVVAVVLGLIIWMSILWLLFSAERFTINGLIIQLLCLGAVGTLVYAGLTLHLPLIATLKSWWATAGMKPGVLIWGTGGVLLTLWAIKRPSARDLPEDKLEIRNEWKRQVRRNKISLIHTRLMITLAVGTIVLLFAGFGHWIIDQLPELGSPKFPLALLPVVSAFGASLFTALKSTPAGGGDKLRVREPSAISRFVFAVTPGLLVAVLAVGAAWLGDELLAHIPQAVKNGTVPVLLTVAIFDGILLCFALAIYEMSWDDPPPSWGLMAYSCLVAFNVGWAVLGVKNFFSLRGQAESSAGVPVQNKWLSLIPLFVGLGILLIAFTRIFGNGKWRRMLEKVRDYKGSPWRAFVMLLILASSLVVLHYSWRTGRHLQQDIAVLMAAIAGLTGGMLLFRLAVARKGAGQTFDLKKSLKATVIGRRQDYLWWFASLCLAVPILVVGLLHLILSEHETSRRSDITITILLAVLGALLPHALILFRKLVIVMERRKDKDAELEERDETKVAEIEPDIIERVLRKIPGVTKQPHATFRMIAGYAIVIGVAAGFTVQGLSRTSIAPQSVWLPLTLPAIIVAFFVSLILFEVAVVRMPVGEKVATTHHFKLADRKLIRKLIRNRSQPFLWLLAGGCMLIAFLIGFLVNLSLKHLGEKSSVPGVLSDLALPGLIACFTVMVFEMWRGKGDNRHTLWLLASAYTALSVLFTIGLVDPNYSKNLRIMVLLTVLGLLAAVMVWIIALGWMVDPNAVSMHQFYKGRLVRAYLGASNVRRFNERKEITEAVAGDDVPLASMKNCQRGAPYHLINTTLNLVAGRDLATAQRSASSFVLAQSYCGSSRTLYRPTAQYMSGRLTLGAAVAASGAAVSPSMGAKKPTAALAMLMTLLNVRLGYWAPTPNRENWRQSQPRLWPFYLLREFLSQTNDLSSYCYLTDGGHFDNTGLYSLVERGCRYIVMADCGADPKPCFEDLGDAIRRCRIDFGTEIELDIEPFIKAGAEGTEQHFVVGTIKYSRKHVRALGWEIKGSEKSEDERRERTGVIIYFKPTATGKVTADVRQYAIENKHFPQQSTANQWFDEAQFESYRRLGQSCAERAFAGLDARPQLQNSNALRPEHVEAIFIEAAEKYSPAKQAPGKAPA